LNQAGNGPQGCAFAGTVGTQYGDNPSLGYLKGYPFQGLDISIVGFYRLKFKHDDLNPHAPELPVTT
jgi:hypothetical protein